MFFNKLCFQFLGSVQVQYGFPRRESYLSALCVLLCMCSYDLFNFSYYQRTQKTTAFFWEDICESWRVQVLQKSKLRKRLFNYILVFFLLPYFWCTNCISDFYNGILIMNQFTFLWMLEMDTFQPSLPINP